MLRFIVICSLILAGCQAGVTDSKFGEKQAIDCVLSPISIDIPGRYKCEQFAKQSAGFGERASSAIFQKSNWSGTAEDGSSISIQLTSALTNGQITASNPKFSYEEEIRDFNSFTRSARNWSPLKSEANAKIMTFVDSGTARSCFGFYMTGGHAYQGAAYSVRGLFCRPSPRAAEYSNDVIAVLLGKIIVRS
jgi:hypothetical protein